MKKILSFVLALTMLALCVVSFGSCKKNRSDWETIEKKGKFVCGITIYQPMNYYDGDELIGFDTELAELVAEKLGVEVEFQEIVWDNKYAELQSGNIDCIWNGFTWNSKDNDGIERSDKVDFTYAYLINHQCVIVKSEDLANYTSVDSLKGKNAAVEKGSAGASFAESAGATLASEKTSQMDTFAELRSGAVDFVVVDRLLGQNIAGQGDFAGLAIANIEIEPEEYSIGCRKNSDFDEKINEALLELLNEGEIERLAEKYHVRVTDSLLAKKDKD